jgi:hypothetical protein
MREFFLRETAGPIEFFNSLRNVAVTDSVAIDVVAPSAHMLGELVGLALRRTLPDGVEPSSGPMWWPATARVVPPFFVVAGLCFALHLLGWGLYFLRVEHRHLTAVENFALQQTKHFDAMLLRFNEMG